jgi:hypothetical protein
MPGPRPRLVYALVLLAAGPAAGRAQTDGPAYWAVTGVRSNDALNLRLGPNADSHAIARIPYNARGLKNFGCPNRVTFQQWLRMSKAQRDRAARSRWCQVEYKGMKGWVHGRFLKEDASPRK